MSRRVRCNVVCASAVPALAIIADFHRVPCAGEVIELPDARHYVVEGIVWTTEEDPRWVEQTARVRPIEPRPFVEVRPL